MQVSQRGGNIFEIFRPATEPTPLYDNDAWRVITQGDGEEVLAARQAPFDASPLPGFQPVRPPPTQQQQQQQQQQPLPAPEVRRIQLERLVDPRQSVGTFMALLADALDVSDANTLRDPETGFFAPRIVGLLEQCCQAMKERGAPRNITVPALIYDHDNQSARVNFATVVKYHILRDSPGNAFAGNVYDNRGMGGRGRLTAQYRISANQAVRRMNARGYNLMVEKAARVRWAPNPLIRRYQATRVDALKRLGALLGRQDDVRLLTTEVEPRLDDETQERVVEEVIKSEEDTFGVDSEEESEDLRARMDPMQVGVLRQRARDAEIARVKAVVRQFRQGVKDLRQYMPFVLVSVTPSYDAYGYNDMGL